jgi:hypothetical protein
MRLVLGAVLVALVLVSTAAPAQAKGATGATIEGPGVTLTVRQEDVHRLAEATRFYEAVFEGASGERPTADPGPRFTIRWAMAAPVGEEVVTQDLYPYAAGGPVVHLPPGQPLYGQPAPGGWQLGGEALTDVLADVGVPAEAPGGRPALGWLLPVAGAGAVLVAWRRRSTAGG